MSETTEQSEEELAAAWGAETEPRRRKRCASRRGN